MRRNATFNGPAFARSFRHDARRLRTGVLFGHGCRLGLTYHASLFLWSGQTRDHVAASACRPSPCTPTRSSECFDTSAHPSPPETNFKLVWKNLLRTEDSQISASGMSERWVSQRAAVTNTTQAERHPVRRNEWHNEPNDWQSVRDNATWEGAVRKFRALTDKSVTKAVEQAYRASGQELRTREFDSVARQVADAVVRNGRSVLAAAKLAFPAHGAPPLRPGLHGVNAAKADKRRSKIGVHLELAEHDLNGGRIFMAAHRVALARVELGRKGERYYYESQVCAAPRRLR